MIGCPEEEAIGFACDESHDGISITSGDAHDGRMPDEIREWFREDADADWVFDETIIFTRGVEEFTRAPAPSVPPVAGATESELRDVKDSGISGEVKLGTPRTSRTIPAAGVVRLSTTSPTSHEVPLALQLNMRVDDHNCAGVYRIIKGREVNGQPVWKLDGGDRWLFSSLDLQTWMIGGPERRPWDLLATKATSRVARRTMGGCQKRCTIGTGKVLMHGGFATKVSSLSKSARGCL